MNTNLPPGTQLVGLWPTLERIELETDTVRMELSQRQGLNLTQVHNSLTTLKALVDRAMKLVEVVGEFPAGRSATDQLDCDDI